MNYLLHEEIFDRLPIVGTHMRRELAQRAGEVAVETAGQMDPAVSVVIRSKNNAAQLEGLFEDIANQQFDGEQEIVLVDTESTDATRAVARQYGATVVSISQAEFNYSKALNRGFMAASFPYVFSFVDHSALSNTQALRVATRWQFRANFAGAYAVALPNKNATWTERIGACVLGVPRVLAAPAHRVTVPEMGLLATNCAVIAKEAWCETGGFDERYGGGGEDGVLGKTMLANGYTIVLDPALSVFHTHGLGPINGLRQLQAWRGMGVPQDFDRTRLERHRPDLT